MIPAEPAGPIEGRFRFATLGDDFRDGVGSDVQIYAATLDADHLTSSVFVTESKTPAAAGQADGSKAECK